MVIADDLFPPQGWDTALLDLITALDPEDVAFAVNVSDSSDESEVLLRHPVVSRAFYQQHGLFNEVYRGVYCDDDITRRAFWRAAILDGRSIVLEHQHPSIDMTVERSDSQSRINSSQEYCYGRDQYLAIWSRQQRSARVRSVESGGPIRLDQLALRRIARRNRALEIGTYPARALCPRLKHPRSFARGLRRRLYASSRRSIGS